MRKPANPFIISGYHSPEYFCDRQEESQWLLEQFENERNVVLYSWRRIGKTALIKHLFYYLEQNKKAETIFVDLLGSINVSEANSRIAQAIVSRFGNVQKGLGAGLVALLGSVGASIGLDPYNGTPKISFKLLPSESVPVSLAVMGDFLSKRKKPIIICIDEFQQVINYQETNAEAIFRQWSQQFPMVRFIFAGSHRQMMISMFSEKSRPFYRSVQMKVLDKLDEETYAKFIQHFFKKSGKQINKPLIDKVFAWTRLQTYYVQLICNKLFAKKAPYDDVLLEEIFTEILQQEIPLFASYQKLLTQFQWKLLIAVAKEENLINPLAKDFISKYALGSASSVSTALKSLVNKEFIIFNEDYYTMHDTLLMRWLQQLG